MNHARLEKCRLSIHHRQIVMFGTIYDDHECRFFDAEHIMTTPIQRFEIVDGAMVVAVTKNTVYHIGDFDMVCELVNKFVTEAKARTKRFALVRERLTKKLHRAIDDQRTLKRLQRDAEVSHNFKSVSMYMRLQTTNSDIIKSLVAQRQHAIYNQTEYHSASNFYAFEMFK